MSELLTRARIRARMLLGKTYVDPDNDILLAELLTDLADEIVRLEHKLDLLQRKYAYRGRTQKAYERRVREIEKRINRSK